MISLFPSTVNEEFIPAGIRIRLHVSLRDPDWKERIVSAVTARDPAIARPVIEPYHLVIHKCPAPLVGALLEVRPRAGTWAPFIAGVPFAEKDSVRLNIMYGPAGRVPIMSALTCSGEGYSEEWSFQFAGNEATPTMSYYLTCCAPPSRLLFGADGGAQYVIENLDW